MVTDKSATLYIIYTYLKYKNVYDANTSKWLKAEFLIRNAN